MVLRDGGYRPRLFVDTGFLQVYAACQAAQLPRNQPKAIVSNGGCFCVANSQRRKRLVDATMLRMTEPRDSADVLANSDVNCMIPDVSDEDLEFWGSELSMRATQLTDSHKVCCR